MDKDGRIDVELLWRLVSVILLRELIAIVLIPLSIIVAYQNDESETMKEREAQFTKPMLAMNDPAHVVRRYICKGRPNRLLTEERLMELDLTFDMWDDDRSSKITTEDLRGIMTCLGYEPMNSVRFDEMSELLTLVDSSGEGFVSKAKFMEMMRAKINSEENEDDLKEALRALDEKERNGYLSPEEFKHVLKQLGEDLSEEDINRLLSATAQEADDKGFTYEDFVLQLLSR